MAKRKHSTTDDSRKKFKEDKKEKKQNPFELKVNRRKHNVVGLRMKGERGNKVVATARANQIREKTLLLEHKSKHKRNTFSDKRFGENDANMTMEEKMLQRFARERQNASRKTNIFNLNDEEEELTHLGQSLGDMDDFNEPDLQLEGHDDDLGLDAKHVRSMHFGGFESNNKEGPKSRKEIMEEIIMKSKMAKHERQTEREDALETMLEIDEEFDQIGSLLSLRKDNPVVATEKHSYDSAVAMLKMDFGMKARASDRLKTEEELAREQNEKLQKLEKERVERMKGLHQVATVTESVETLNDNVEKKDDRKTLTYVDGVMHVDGKPFVIQTSSKSKEIKYDQESEEEEGEEDHSQNDSESVSSSDEEDNRDVISEEDDSSDVSDDSDVKDDEEATATATSIDDNVDGHRNSKEIAALEQKLSELKKKKNTDRKQKPKSSAALGTATEAEDTSEIDSLPFTFDIPKDLPDWLNSVEKFSDKQILTVVARTIACHHKSLHPDNVSKLSLYLQILLSYFGHLAQRKNFATMDKLTVMIYELSQQMPEIIALSSQKLLSNMNDHLDKSLSTRNGKKNYLPIQSIMYIRLITLIFPTSDNRHPVTTPAALLMGKYLSWIPFSRPIDILRGLFLSDVFLQFVADSKRYAPEPINFLSDIFFAFNKSNGIAYSTNVFDQGSPLTEGKLDWLKIATNNKKLSKLKVTLNCSLNDLVNTKYNDGADVDDLFKLNLLLRTIDLTKRFIAVYSSSKSFDSIISPIFHHVNHISASNMPTVLQENISELKNLIEENLKKCNSGRVHQMLQKRKAVAIKQYNPKFEEGYQGRSFDPNKDRRENKKMAYQVKREKKGAMRELRKDTQFLARQKYKETKENDQDRNSRVKNLMSQLSSQQAEKNQAEREKSKNKGK